MKFNIHIDQKYCMENGLDILDYAIFDVIMGMIASDRMQKKMIDGQVYTWCALAKIIDEMPCLPINSKRALQKRMDTLRGKGLISTITLPQDGNKLFIRRGEKADSAIFGNGGVVNKDSLPPRTQVRQVANVDSPNPITNPSTKIILRGKMKDQEHFSKGDDAIKKTGNSSLPEPLQTSENVPAAAADPTRQFASREEALANIPKFRNVKEAAQWHIRNTHPNNYKPFRPGRP